MTDFIPGDYDRYLFHRGRHFQSYNFMGSHLCEENGQKGARFNLWAPNAREISIIGDFNNWQPDKHTMHKIPDSQLWTLFIPDLKEGDLYKYYITGYQGKIREKADPYAVFAERKPGTASRIYSLSRYNWNDEKWLQKRREIKPHRHPLSIYEVHPGSWKRKNGQPLNYRELADELIPYVQEMKFTHIELLPITEYPFDGSWGYQTTGYYAATSRYGEPRDFMYLVDRCHQAGMGVIIDWVPGHFCKDDHGLRLFDGTPLFESEDPRRAENIQWDTLNFDFAQPEVWSFLISNALFWLREYHIDGIRMDAVSNMLYLNYGKEEGQWSPNKYGGNENIEAIKFIKTLNREAFREFPGLLMVAEESTTWPLVSAPTDTGGLGFNFKWNMGWMNDTLSYMEDDPIYRKWNHDKLTFSIMYTHSENYILPLSHDEVVHGKKSLLDKMPGDYWQKFANLRLLYAYMMAHPGKKLLFMGGEFGQFIEWDYKQELDWHLLDYELHGKMKHYLQQLNHVYRREEPLWQLDHEHNGFSWIEANDSGNSVISFIRYPEDDNNPLIVICNFTPVPRQNYQIGVPESENYWEIFNSDLEEYGGSGDYRNGKIKTNTGQRHGFPSYINPDLPPLGAIYLKK